MYPFLSKLVSLRPFRFFKVRLRCSCPFWRDESKCKSKYCSVCECTNDEIPVLPWKRDLANGKNGTFTSNASVNLNEGKFVIDDTQMPEKCFDFVNKEYSNETMSSVEDKIDTLSWAETDNPWTAEDESVDDNALYVDLMLHPERYTGYTGEEAHRIWNAIYEQNCFLELSGQRKSDSCTEKRILYRLISGMHTSITAHIVAIYPENKIEVEGHENGIPSSESYFDEENVVKWGYNLRLFEERIARHPSRVENLYFTFLFVLRAVVKAKELLVGIDYRTGDTAEDEMAKILVNELVLDDRLYEACPLPFDFEGRIWTDEGGYELKHQLMDHFRNITSIMDCVGCEKCRLWGKLQTLGNMK